MAEKFAETMYLEMLAMTNLNLELPDINVDSLRDTDEPIELLCITATNKYLDYTRAILDQSRAVAEQMLKIFNFGSVDSVGYMQWTYKMFEGPILPRSLKNLKGRAIGNEIREITLAKGLLPEAETITANEHMVRGNIVCVPIRNRASNIPINYVRRLLRDEGKTDMVDEQRKLYTPNQIDRSRRLAGLTAINTETGEIMDQVDTQASSDLYYFLSPEEKDTLLDQERSVYINTVKLYSDAIRKSKEALVVMTILRAYAQAQVTTDEMELMINLFIKAPGLPMFINDELSKARQLAIDKGLLDPILTPQEIMMRTSGRVEDKYTDKPYTPIAVQNGRMSPSEVQEIRKTEAHITHSFFAEGSEQLWCISLAELDTDGNTTTSPQLLDTVTHVPITVDNSFKEQYRKSFPIQFARPKDWYHSADRGQ